MQRETSTNVSSPGTRLLRRSLKLPSNCRVNATTSRELVSDLKRHDIPRSWPSISSNRSGVLGASDQFDKFREVPPYTAPGIRVQRSYLIALSPSHPCYEVNEHALAEFSVIKINPFRSNRLA